MAGGESFASVLATAVAWFATVGTVPVDAQDPAVALVVPVAGEFVETGPPHEGFAACGHSLAVPGPASQQRVHAPTVRNG